MEFNSSSWFIIIQYLCHIIIIYINNKKKRNKVLIFFQFMQTVELINYYYFKYKNWIHDKKKYSYKNIQSTIRTYIEYKNNPSTVPKKLILGVVICATA